MDFAHLRLLPMALLYMRWQFSDEETRHRWEAQPGSA
jgi:hypothetical protein